LNESKILESKKQYGKATSNIFMIIEGVCKKFVKHKFLKYFLLAYGSS